MTYIHQSLLSDGSLILSVEKKLRVLTQEWMPSLDESSSASHPATASIQVDTAPVHAAVPSGPPTLALGRVSAWVDARNDSAWLQIPGGALSASIDLAERTARVGVASDIDIEPRDLTSILTIAAALLLVRDGRTPIHAAGVVHPATGRAWLLAGDSHSGKSTTTANLIKAGWSYLSDDYVVLTAAASSGEIAVQGWPDDFHLDAGWHRGEATGIRATVKEAELPQGYRAISANLSGLIFPRISPSERTAAMAVSPAVALERLIRQSPWLMADSKGAPRVLDLLRDAASGISVELSLGLDTYSNPALLHSVISSALLESPSSPGELSRE